jgi:hypothetical protein
MNDGAIQLIDSKIIICAIVIHLQCRILFVNDEITSVCLILAYKSNIQAFLLNSCLHLFNITCIFQLKM